MKFSLLSDFWFWFGLVYIEYLKNIFMGILGILF